MVVRVQGLREDCCSKFDVVSLPPFNDVNQLLHSSLVTQYCFDRCAQTQPCHGQLQRPAMRPLALAVALQLLMTVLVHALFAPAAAGSEPLLRAGDHARKLRIRQAKPRHALQAHAGLHHMWAESRMLLYATLRRDVPAGEKCRNTVQGL